MSVLANIYKSLFAPKSHIHAQAEVTDLTTTLAGKSNTGHMHAISEVTNLQSSLDGKASSNHNHVVADIMGYVAAVESYTNGLDGNHAANLPGGLQLRWGSFTNGTSITFAEAFTTECQCVVTNASIASTTPHIVQSKSKTGCVIIAVGDGPYQGYYFAIGR